MKTSLRTGVLGIAMLGLLGTSLVFTNTPAQAQSGLGKIIGVAFSDDNKNGKRDPGESTLFARYKVTNGGNFWVCGSTGSGATYGVTVTPGKYFVMPIAGPGYYTTAPVIQVEVKGPGQTAVADLPFAPSALASPDQCGAYAPKRAARVPWNIPDAALANGLLTLRTAIEAAGLYDTLAGPGPFTVFAPNDLAFAKINDEDLNAILKDKSLLTSILTYHVVPGRVSANDVVNSDTLVTVNGKSLSVELVGDEVLVGGARVIATDIQTANGIVHVIDTVLVP